MKKLSERERKTMVACMEFISRNINDESIFESWLYCGVADGDLDYHNLVINFSEETEQVNEYFIEEENFADLMGLFLRMMTKANKSGGLYCDGVVSR